jgi:hypothetical protein
MAIRFSGEGKWRGEWGVKMGESVAPFPGEEGLSGRWQRMREVAAASLDRLPEEEESRAADGAGPPVSEGAGGGAGWARRGRKRGGP